MIATPRPRDARRYPDGREDLPPRVIVAGDWLTPAGAQRLAEIVMSYWERRGFDTVRVALDHEGELVVLRGNLVAGLPPAEASPAPAIAARTELALPALEEPRDRGPRAPAWLSRLVSSLARLA